MLPTDKWERERGRPPWSNDPESKRAPDYPRYVRVLAVAYVLSLAVGPAGFFILMITAGVLRMQRGAVDAVVIGVGISALCCPMLCAMFRTWFRRFGRRNWPEG